ncbi:hemerythrin domain-containing protein [Streptomyces sp. NBC_01571]|uniref:hemerythrin domain-containing protein n=1 Tax=Streptomyces sp. NBC_01571 TaxID=2975883 RepID=UPI002256E10F|nr:hemerythrin domain-containing protein [Streptomyces sp. NBC_01571]MCX4579881.1 hemerythrin domain-containing protein [Streptomyces sp. NBC_01571]
MTLTPPTDVPAVVETRLAHDVHRAATTLLAEAALDASVPLGATAQLRDFLVANLRHHHQTEDDDLWPRITAKAPAAAQSLDSLTDEHDQLDAALDRLAGVAVHVGEAVAGVPLTTAGTGDGAATPGEAAVRAELHDAAVTVRDVVHDHLTHEEPVLFPALREHVSPAEWQDFAQRVIATTPPVAGHLMVGFLDEVGTSAEVELVLSGLPEPVRPLVPAMRLQAEADLGILRGTGV